MRILAAFCLLFITSLSFSQEVTLNTTEPTALYVQANQLLNNGNPKHAKDTFKQIINFYEREGRLKEISENYLGMALAFAFNANYTESIRFHKKALRAHHRYRAGESDDAIVFNLALTYQLAGKTRKAEKLNPTASVYFSRK